MSKPFYVTTSIAYVNAEPHIGFAMESIEADALARYHRLKGDDTYFLTGTDEHGIKQQRTAEEMGITPQELCDTNAAKFKALKELLWLSNDDFIRTSDQKKHWPSVIKLWKKLVENGDIYKDTYEAYYCSGCEAFITEKELVDGKCPNHNREPEKVQEENYFFRLSKYSDQVLKLIESKELEIIPDFRANEIVNVIKEGLQDVSFSRPTSSLTWGVPVPDDPDQTMYVWCDALTNYISAIGYAEDSEQFKKYWPYSVHVIGKDIVRFHVAIWPAMLIAAGIKPPHQCFVHGFITSEGQKMSKSLGNVVNPKDVVEEYGVDALRYYLLAEIPVGRDGDFSMELFKERYNAHLANSLGNLVNRVLMMSKKYEVELNWDSIDGDNECADFVSKIWEDFEKSMDGHMLHEGIAKAWEVVHFANKYIDTHAPWKLIKEDPTKTHQVLLNLLELLRHISLLISPFLPKAAGEIEKMLGVSASGAMSEEKIWLKHKDWKSINEAEVLFPRLEE